MLRRACRSIADQGRGALTLTLHLLLLVGIAACSGEKPAAPPAQPAGTPAAEKQSAPPPAAPSEAARKAQASSPLLEKIQKIQDIPSSVEDPDQAVEQLRGWLGDTDRDIREAAILALWDLETEKANQALAQIAKTEADPELKGYAVEELVDREAPEALDALLHVLNDADTDLREQAAEGLETLEDPRSIEGLRSRLKTEEDEWVRDAIKSALETVDPEFDADSVQE